MLADNRQKGTIKQLQKALNLSQDIYEDILFQAYGITSSTELTTHQAREFIHDLKKQAINAGVWKSNKKSFNKYKYDNFGHRPGFATPKQLRMINAMWHSSSAVREKTDQAFEKFIFKRIAGVDHLKWLPQSAVQKIVYAIENLK